MIKTQRGISLMGLIMGLFIVVLLALFAMKLVPSFLEYRSAKAAIEAISKSSAQGAGEVRRAFESRAAIDDINSIKATDLEITREGNQMVIGFAYRKEVQLVGNVGIYIDYVANTRGSQ
jgi:hypothetical protein